MVVKYPSDVGMVHGNQPMFAVATDRFHRFDRADTRVFGPLEEEDGCYDCYAMKTQENEYETIDWIECLQCFHWSR